MSSSIFRRVSLHAVNSSAVYIRTALGRSGAAADRAGTLRCAAVLRDIHARHFWPDLVPDRDTTSAHLHTQTPPTLFDTLAAEPTRLTDRPSTSPEGAINFASNCQQHHQFHHHHGTSEDMLVRELDPQGSVTEYRISTNEARQDFKLPPRNIKLLRSRGQEFSSVLVQPEYFLFRFEMFKGYCQHNRVVFFDVEDNPAMQVVETHIREVLKTHPPEKGLPFEYLVMEAVLDETYDYFENAFTRWNTLITGELHSLLHGTAAAKRSRFRSIIPNTHDNLADCNERREEGFSRLLPLENALGKLRIRAQRVNRSIKGLLASDEDLAMLYLTHRREEGAARAIEDHSEFELLLEAFSDRLDNLDDQMGELVSRIGTFRALMELSLDNERNSIMRLGLYISISSLACGIMAAGAGFFGMNLNSGVEDLGFMLWPAMGLVCSVAWITYSSWWSKFTRLRLLQGQRMVDHSVLQSVLGHMDSLYFTLRTNPHLTTRLKETNRLTRGDVMEMLGKANLGRLTEREVEVLMSALDTSQNGTIEDRELKGLTGNQTHPETIKR